MSARSRRRRGEQRRAATTEGVDVPEAVAQLSRVDAGDRTGRDDPVRSGGGGGQVGGTHPDVGPQLAEAVVRHHVPEATAVGELALVGGGDHGVPRAVPSRCGLAAADVLGALAFEQPARQAVAPVGRLQFTRRDHARERGAHRPAGDAEQLGERHQRPRRQHRRVRAEQDGQCQGAGVEWFETEFTVAGSSSSSFSTRVSLSLLTTIRNGNICGDGSRASGMHRQGDMVPPRRALARRAAHGTAQRARHAQPAVARAAAPDPQRPQRRRRRRRRSPSRSAS